MIGYHKSKGHEITVVFDGWAEGKGKETREGIGGISVVYSGIGEKADAVIRRMIADRTHKWVVVSSDREIESSAWAVSSVPIASGLFLRYLVEKNEDGNYGALDSEENEDYSDSAKKGSSRKPSRKQKEIRKVVEKL